MADLDDFGELYADLEDQEIDIVRALEEEDGDNNELDENGAGYENGTVESCSSSESEDDLQIVLNEDNYSNKLPFQLITAGRDCEDVGDDDPVIVTGTDCYGKELKMAELGQSADGLLRVNKDMGNSTKGAHRNSVIFCSPGSALRSWSSLSGKDHWDHLTVPCALGNASYNIGFPIAFPNGYDFYLPRNRSIFDIDVESFDCKPWRFNGVDVTDYFNFGLDEEGWRTYCKHLQVHFQQKFPAFQSYKLTKPTCTMSGEVARHVHDKGPEILNFLHNERKGIRMPKGRAIQVESGNGDRIPSIDVRRPRNQDLDVVIQITTGPVAEDALDPTKDRTTHVDDTVSKSEILSNTNNNFCKRDSSSRVLSFTKPDAVVADHYCSSSKSSDHNGSLEASRDDAFLVKVSSPECDHLNSDSWFQETDLSDCYLSNETGSDISKIDCTICGGDASKSFLNLNYSEQATNHGIVKLNLGSDDELASPPLPRKKDGKYQMKHSDTVVRKWDDEFNERDHSSQGGKISRRIKNKQHKGEESKATSFLACLGGHDEDSSPVLNREKRYPVINSEFKTRRNDCYVRSTSRKFKTRINDCYVSQKSQHNSRIQIDIVNRNYLNSNSRNMSLYYRRVCCTSRRVDDHDTMKEAHCTMKAKSRCREKSSSEYRESSFSEYKERSLNEYRERSLDNQRERDLAEYIDIPYIYEEEERSTDKCDRVPCSSGALRRCHELFSCEENHLFDFEWSSRYANEEGSRLCDDSHRNRTPSLFKLNKRYMSHSEYSHPQESFPAMSNKHLIVSRKKCHKYFSKTDLNLDHDQSAEGRAAYPDNTAYNESILPLPGILPKKEVNFKHQDSILSFPTRYTLYGNGHHQNGQTDRRSFNGQKVSGNHLRNRDRIEFNVRSAKDVDSSGRVGSLSDNFVKNRRETHTSCYKEAVSKHLNGWKAKSIGRSTSTGRRSQLANYKESRIFNYTEDSSNHKMKTTRNHLCPEKEVEELEEGQLVEESDSYETEEIKFISDSKTLPSTAKMDLTYSGLKNKLVGGYDRNHLLETLAKMEKRRERFKDPILPKKEQENRGDMQPDTAIKDEIKHQRPSRKRRWCSS